MSRKPKKSAKMNASTKAKITKAIEGIEAHYAVVRSVWEEIPQTQRVAFLAVCPLLSRIKDFTEGFN